MKLLLYVLLLPGACVAIGDNAATVTAASIVAGVTNRGKANSVEYITIVPSVNVDKAKTARSSKVARAKSWQRQSDEQHHQHHALPMAITTKKKHWWMI